MERRWSTSPKSERRRDGSVQGRGEVLEWKVVVTDNSKMVKQRPLLRRAQA